MKTSNKIQIKFQKIKKSGTKEKKRKLINCRIDEVAFPKLRWLGEHF